MMRALYRLLTWLSLPYALARLAWRARRQPEYLRHVAERFGMGGATCASAPLWIHAVSVGETRAAEPLIRALRQRHADLPLLLTCTTPTGRATGAQLFDGAVTQAYYPYDVPFAVQRFLARQRPRMALLLETELWPEMIFACQARGIPLHVINARLSERSARRYARAGAFMTTVLAAVQSIAAQSAADAQRFRQLGATRVQVCGNLKFDRAASAAEQALGAQFRARIGSRPTVLAASTREGEEALLLSAWDDAQVSDALLVLVPRHPQRFEEVARLIQARGLRLQRRGDQAALAPTTQVWLGDSMGEMFAYYCACHVAIIGGSFAPLGGQNLLEACAVGAPVIMGPHMFNFTEASNLALQAQAALQVSNATQAVAQALRLARDPDLARAMGERGHALMRAHQGATERVLSSVSL